MSAARSFRDLRVYQLARTAAREVFELSRMDPTWRSIGGMVGRMIDRAADFCKYASDTDFRGTVMEGPLTIDEMLFDGLDDQQETNA